MKCYRNEWKNIPCSYTRNPNTVEMALLPELIYTTDLMQFQSKISEVG